MLNFVSIIVCTKQIKTRHCFEIYKQSLQNKFLCFKMRY
jgi:hypothetical protein